MGAFDMDECEVDFDQLAAQQEVEQRIEIIIPDAAWTHPPHSPPRPMRVTQLCEPSSSAAQSIASDSIESPPAVQSESLVAPELKRRRISQKRQCPAEWSPQCSERVVLPQCEPDSDESSNPTPGDCQPMQIDDATVKHVVNFPLKQNWFAWTPRRQYDWVFEAVRLYWSKLPSTKQKFGESATYRDIRKLFKLMTKEEKQTFAVNFAEKFKAPDYVRRAMDAAFGNKKDKDSRLFGKTAIITYHGEWGLKTDGGEEWVDMSGMSIDEVVEMLRSDPKLREVFDDFKGFAEDVQENLCCSDMSCCIELCTETFESKRIAKCHSHLWLRGAKRIYAPDVTKLWFNGHRPNFSGVINGIVRETRTASFMGALYTSNMKIGSVFTHATRQAFSGYLVQPTWLMNLLQSGKIKFDTAREGVVRSCQNVTRYLKDLEVLEEHYRKIEIQREIVRVQLALQARRKPFIEIEQVQRWKRQYEFDEFRYCFLVLEGPSRVGKTQFVRSIVGDEAILELNCAGGTPIDLRGFQRHRHKLVLYDEIDPEQVLTQRKVFQAGPAPVQLGQSQTGMYAYEVFVHKIMFVLCSNSWSVSLARLSEADQDWIKANQIFVQVDQPLWKK